MSTVVTFGEIMLRLSPPGFERFLQSPVLGATFGGGDEPLAAGMILSNEPGYYKAGDYGIRIENLVLVTPRDVPGAEGEMLGFETLTFAPIDRQLIAVALLALFLVLVKGT